MKLNNKQRSLLDCHKRPKAGRLPVYTTARRNARLRIEEIKERKRLANQLNTLSTENV